MLSAEELKQTMAASQPTVHSNEPILLKVLKGEESKIIKCLENELVSDCLKRMCKKFAITNDSDYGVWRPPPFGVWLVVDKEIADYRLKSMDELELRRKNHEAPLQRAKAVISRRNQEGYLPGDQAGDSVVRVLFPERDAQHTIKICEDDKIQDLVDKVVKKQPAGSIPFPEDYSMVAVYLEETSKELRMLLNRAREFKSYQFTALKYLVCQRAFLRVKVKLLADQEKGVVEMIVKPATITCGNLSKKILHEYPPPSELKTMYFALFRPSKALGWQMLDTHRSVESYNLKPGEILEFGTLGREQGIQAKSEEEAHQKIRKARVTSKVFLYVTIDSPAHGVKSTFHFDPTVKISGLFEMFIELNPIEKEANYCLYYRPHEGNNQADWTEMEFDKKLSTFRLRQMDTILFAPKGMQKKSVKNKFKSTTSGHQVFGVDPTGLPMVDDYGFQVPVHLQLLRKQLTMNDGLHTEGLFRMAGSEPDIKLIRKNILKGTYQPVKTHIPQQLHNVANLLKRWYCELPVRIFGLLPANTLADCAEDPSLITSLPDKIPEPHHGLFLWFIDLLVSIAMHVESNKMTAHNLAISVGPIFLQFDPNENPMNSLVKTQRVVTILEKLVEDRLPGQETVDEGLKDSDEATGMTSNASPVVDKVNQRSQSFDAGVTQPKDRTKRPEPPSRLARRTLSANSDSYSREDTRPARPTRPASVSHPPKPKLPHNRRILPKNRPASASHPPAPKPKPPQPKPRPPRATPAQPSPRSPRYSPKPNSPKPKRPYRSAATQQTTQATNHQPGGAAAAGLKLGKPASPKSPGATASQQPTQTANHQTGSGVSAAGLKFGKPALPKSSGARRLTGR